MSLYDDVDTTQKLENWSSGISKLLPQPNLAKIQQQQKKTTLLTPVISVKPKTAIDFKPREAIKPKLIYNQPIPPLAPAVRTQGSEWDEFLSVQDEYNPSIPNEYEKIVKERREKNKSDDRKRNRSPSPKKSGFGARRRQSSDEEENFRPPIASNRVGASIAPPRSLQESSPISDLPNIAPNYGSNVAAKIMAKYGFKDGQGLGKLEQGISTALVVEKTSKRGGRIINEKELLPAQAQMPQTSVAPPPQETDEDSSEVSITELMKNPSKVILLRNMVGPGEVDDDLEPEVKDECTTKYGEVLTVHILEMSNKIPEETVRIFVEFKKIEHAIKALVDLNGRFFGGRQVRCCFYEADKYENFIFDA